jgi:chemotaxis protein CheD
VTEIVSISDAKVSIDPEAVLATFSLGSCIGVTLYDPVRKIAGMLHFQLPTSTMDVQRAKQNPFMFADTGFGQLLGEMTRRGGEKKRLKVRMAGAAQMLNDSALFDIGRRNHAAMRKILWQHGLLIDAEHIGGNTPRTMYLAVVDGSVKIKMGPEMIEL